MRVIIRSDASYDIGSGHIMRCLTLAESLREHGSVCHFICREHPGNLLELIRQRGFDVFVLPAAEFTDTVVDAQINNRSHYSVWLGAGWKKDAQETMALLDGKAYDWLIVDHYALDSRWESEVRKYVRRVMVIDDLADRHHNCDLLLDHNLGRTDADYSELVPVGCTIITGPKYALLQPEYSALRQYSLQRREIPALQRILITMGGVDRPNATCAVLDALRRCPLPSDCHITVVMGAQAKWIESVYKLADMLPWPVDVRVNISDMAQVMADSDLAIGATGCTSLERCCLGLPTLQVVLSENQRANAQALHNQGGGLLIGEPVAIHQKLADTLEFLLEYGRMTELSLSARVVTDGLGVWRVVEQMVSQS